MKQPCEQTYGNDDLSQVPGSPPELHHVAIGGRLGGMSIPLPPHRPSRRYPFKLIQIKQCCLHVLEVSRMQIATRQGCGVVEQE
jgi:hypothetical protein